MSQRLQPYRDHKHFANGLELADDDRPQYRYQYREQIHGQGLKRVIPLSPEALTISYSHMIYYNQNKVCCLNNY